MELSSTIFLSLWYDLTWDWTLIFRPLVNTLPTKPMSRDCYKHFKFKLVFGEHIKEINIVI